MCQYCTYRDQEGWSQLLEYDETYQTAVAAETASTYGFHESWDELKEDVGYGA
ncbi:hypothetical protein [Haloarcula litorea]|uniref:hypothetical protein n=1 Tax=Haloarcula litorea TaxID=3032579 RepID=UPI0023E8B86B|nr:hypothetical protein [Halomicroarcula sp. GDY20]